MAWTSLSLLAACGGGGSSPTAPLTPVPTPTPAPSVRVVRSASFRGSNGHAASGTVEIIQNGGSFSLAFRGDFRIDGGSNDVYLARNPDGISSDDLNLGNLASRSGAQSYVMPNDGSSYPYVLLWCRPFRVPIAFGELR
jgi:hypothetical protein